MKRGFIVVCALLSVVATALPLAQDRPTYVLETSATVEQGIRPYNRTVYTYYRAFGDRRQELWRITLNEKYATHWIGEGGKVWVLTAGDMRGRSAPTVWVRDPEASYLAKVNLSAAMQSLASDLQPSPQFAGWNFDKEASNLIKHERYGSQLKVVLEDQGEIHINAVPSEGGPRYLVTWNATENTTNELEELLEENSSLRPIRPLANEENWEIWSANNVVGPGVLTIYETDRTFGHTNVRLVKRQHSLATLPSYVTKSPGHRVLWFTFGSSGGAREAKLTVYSSIGMQIGEVDFLKLGAYKYSGEAERSLDYTNVQLQKGNYWQSLLKADFGYTSTPPETIRILDHQGFQYIIKMEGFGREGTVIESERFPPENFSITRERESNGYKVTDEKLWNSASGEFVFRLRTLEDDKGKTRYRQTLLRVDSRVKEYEHEFWSSSTLSMPLDVFVSNSGRTFFLFTMKLRKDATEDLRDHVVLSVKDYDGSQQLGGLQVIDMYYSLYESALDADLSGMSATYDAPERPIRFEGAIVPRFAQENYVWKLPDGKIWRRQFTTVGS